MINIRDADEILSISKAGDLFTDDIDKIKLEYKEFAKLWHPDMNNDLRASDVFTKITELYYKGIELLEKGNWEKTNYILLPKDNGKKVSLNYETSFDFELGICYVSKTKVLYILDNDKEKYYNNALRAINLLRYKDKEMENDLQRFFPKIYDKFKTQDGNYVLVLEKDEDVVPLKSVYNYFDYKIEDRHVAWIISRLCNLSCFLKYNSLVHNGINMDNCFISPKNHSILLFGGWWYTTEENEKMIGTTKDIFSIMSVAAKGSKQSDCLTDLESIKLLGRQLLGETNCRKLSLDKSIPAPFVNFLIGGSGSNSYEEYSKWDNALNASYGKRKFIHMEIQNVYRKKGE